jgi:hypothetical protein
MKPPRRRARGLTGRLVDSGALQAFGLDALLLTAAVLVGVGVYRTLPALVWIYAGLLVLVTWWSIGKTQAKDAKPS